MSNISIEGFDWFASGITNEATRKALWATKDWVVTSSNSSIVGGAGIPDVGPGRLSGQCMSFTEVLGSTALSGNFIFTRKTLFGNIHKGYVGIAVYIASSPAPAPFTSYDRPEFFFQLHDAGVGSQISIKFNMDGTGQISVFRGNTDNTAWATPGTLLGITTAGAFRYDRWFYLEIGSTIDPTAGQVQVRVNTVPVLNFTGNTQNTADNYFSDFSVVYWVNSILATTHTNFYLDDFYVNDDQGSTCNSFMGNCRVQTQFPSGAGASTTFSVTGAATNWQAVNNYLVDDSEYVYTPTTGNIDLYAVSNISPTNVIYAVQIAGAYRQDDATQVIARNVLRVGGTNYEGHDLYTDLTYTFRRDVWELNPATGLSWTNTDVNAIQIGPKKQL